MKPALDVCACQRIHGKVETAIASHDGSMLWHREVEEPHQLHFDVKEAALRQGLQHYRLEHPVSPPLSQNEHPARMRFYN